MAAYPSTLPGPLVQGYAVSPVDKTLRTEMDAGAGRVRLRSRARLDRVQATWRFKAAEMAAFRAWFESPTGAGFGAAFFDISLPLGHAAPETRVARFAAPPQYRALGTGPVWEVSAELEVR